MFTNRRISPASSQIRLLRPGNCPVNDSIIAWMSDACVSTSLLPPVIGRRGVGMRTFTIPSNLSCRVSPMRGQVECLLELYQAGGNARRPAHRVNDRILRFEAVARDQRDRDIASFDDALFRQFLENPHGDTSPVSAKMPSVCARSVMPSTI